MPAWCFAMVRVKTFAHCALSDAATSNCRIFLLINSCRKQRVCFTPARSRGVRWKYGHPFIMNVNVYREFYKSLVWRQVQRPLLAWLSLQLIQCLLHFFSGNIVDHPLRKSFIRWVAAEYYHADIKNNREKGQYISQEVSQICKRRKSKLRGWQFILPVSVIPISDKFIHDHQYIDFAPTLLSWIAHLILIYMPTQ